MDLVHDIHLEQRYRAWRLRVELAWPQWRIAEELGVDQSTISRWLQMVVDERQQALSGYIHQIVHEQYEQLLQVASEAWQAWHRSRLPYKNVRKEVNQIKAPVLPPGASAGAAPNYIGTGVQDETISTEVEERDGNPRFLSEYRSALDDIRQLFGVEPTGDASPATAVAGTQVLIYLPDNGRSSGESVREVGPTDA